MRNKIITMGIMCMFFGACIIPSISGNISKISSLNNEEVGWNVKFIGSLDTPGAAYDVFVIGDYAYVADGNHGLQIIDVSNPTGPNLIGSYGTSDIARGIFVQDDYAYVASHDAGLYIFDVSDPSDPSLVGNYDTPGSAIGVFILDNYAYVADFRSGLQIIDVSNPYNPTLVGNCDTPGASYAAFVLDDYAYVADDTSGLQIIDISDLANPNIIGSYTPSDKPSGWFRAFGVSIYKDYAYVADGASGDAGFYIIDVSDPANPTHVKRFNTPGDSYDVFISDGYAFVADLYEGGLRVFDVTKPTESSRIAGYYDTPGWALGVYIVDNYAYVADENAGGLQILEFTGRGLPYKPDKPSGPTRGKTGKIYTYTVGTTDPDGDKILYMFDWNASGSHEYSNWLGSFPSGEIIEASHSWAEHGTYKIKVKAKDVNGAESEWSDPLIVTIVVADYDVGLSCDDPFHDVKPGETTTFIVETTNTGALDDTYDVTASSIEDIVCLVNGVNADQFDPYEITLAAGESTTFEVTAEIWESVPKGKWGVFVDAKSQNDSTVEDHLILTANVKSKNKQIEKPHFIKLLELLTDRFPVLARLLNLQ